jgi:hypothetical protein
VTAFVRRDLRAAFVPWVVARVLVVGALGVARYGADVFTGAARPVQLDQGLFAWDAAFYRGIAEHGYGALGGALRFFPLVPILARGLGWVLAGNDAVALIVLANASALLLGGLVHRLALRETGDARLAVRAAWFAAVFPAAAVLVMGYAEATFMALSAAMFLALRARTWKWAAAAGVLAGLTRPAAPLLVVPAAIEAARGWGAASVRERVERVAAVVSPLVGFFAYLAWVSREYGDFWLPLRLQNAAKRRGGFANPVLSFFDSVGDLFTGDRFGSGVHALWALVFLGLAVVLLRRLPLAYGAYAGITVVLGLAAENLDSFERYAMSAFPFALAVALVTGREDVERPVVVLAGAGLVGYATLTFLGRYVA